MRWPLWLRRNSTKLREHMSYFGPEPLEGSQPSIARKKTCAHADNGAGRYAEASVLFKPADGCYCRDNVAPAVVWSCNNHCPIPASSQEPLAQWTLTTIAPRF